MTVTWSDVQLRRLKELDADEAEIAAAFADIQKRDQAFQSLEQKLVRRCKLLLQEFRDIHLRPRLLQLESTLVETLVGQGFVQVATPTIMSRSLLKKMSIDESNPLHFQIFWLNKDKCLRPMLAPHLYSVLKDLLRVWEKPVRIFELGPCFRKESQGAKHSAEFTMLNLVEMGLPEERRQARIEELIALVAGAARIGGYSFETRTSTVYGETIDVLAGEEKIELGSGVLGPHALDRAWRISDPWVGIGFGLERLLMVREKGKSIRKYGRSLAYLDGVRLNL